MTVEHEDTLFSALEDHGAEPPVEGEPHPTEGVRIFGATEAARLVGPEAGEDQGTESHPGVSSGEAEVIAAPGSEVEMPHWTDPATGEVPASLAREEEGASSALTSVAGPSWSDDKTGWQDDDFDHSMLADQDAGDEHAEIVATRPRDLLEMEEQDHGAATGYAHEDGDSDGDPAGGVVDAAGGPGTSSQGLPGLGSVVGSRHTVRIDSGNIRVPSSGSPAEDAGPTARARRPAHRGDRNVGVAVGVGLLIGAAIVVLFLFGSASALLVATAAVTLAVAEYFAVMRRAGYQPASLLGLVATVCLMVAAYEKGEPAVAVVLAIMVAFTLLWYLWGVSAERPVTGVAVTLLGFLWVSFLGSFAALLLSPSIHPQRHGVALLFGAITATVAYDVGAYAAGSRMGKHLLAPRISPKKTWEGLIAGMLAAIVVSAIFISHIHPWTLGRSLALGLVVAAIAPLGDLCQSMIKRDAGVKDMSSVLPGHGGVLDRIDAMLFVMPAVYFLARVLNIS